MITFNNIKTFDDLPTLKEVESISNSLINILSYFNNINLEKIFADNIDSENIDEIKQKAKCSLFFMFYLLNINYKEINNNSIYLMIGKYLSYTNLSEDKLKKVLHNILEEDLNSKSLTSKYETITQTINLSKKPYTEEDYILKNYFFYNYSFLIRLADFGYLFIKDTINKNWINNYNNSGINNLFEKYNNQEKKYIDNVINVINVILKHNIG